MLHRLARYYGICYFQFVNIKRQTLIIRRWIIRSIAMLLIQTFYWSFLTLYVPNYFPPEEKNHFFASVVINFFRWLFENNKKKFLITGYPSFEIEQIWSTMFRAKNNQIKCFWKAHEKIVCESYFGRTYGISFIEKIKRLIFWKNNCFFKNFYLFLDIKLQ